MRSSLSLFGTVFALRGAYAAIYTDPAQLPARDYDYVIVGAGPAGSVVARRLAENSNTTVLIIDAGQLPDNVEDISAPYLNSGLGTDFYWEYSTVPQTGLNNRSVSYPRGKALGGSTCVNDLVWTRGSKDDFDRWASVTGDDGWSWDSLQSYMMAVEDLGPPSDGRDVTGEVDPSVHGTSGLVGISPQSVTTNLDPFVIGTTSELAEFPFNEDANSGNTIGVGYSQYSIKNGSRQDAANTYLEPASGWDNLDILIGTQVTKVIQTGEEDGVPVINGVQFAQSSSSPLYSINATQEVILSAGSLNSPQILLLSGLGPTADLTALGIDTVVDLPYVGSNLQDHALLTSNWEVNATFTWDDVNRNTTLLGELVAEWEANKTGIVSAGATLQIGWLRIPDNDTIFETYEDPSAGPTSAHYELVFVDNFFGAPPSETAHYLTVVTNVISPTSRGSLKLNTTSPWDAPLIDPALLESDFDMYVMVYAQKAARRFVASSTFSSYIIDIYSPANATTDDDLAAYARANAGTVFHPVGTTAMSAADDTTSGVVNPDLTVKGTKGLRVIDAGVFPFVPSAHTQAAVYILAERAADIVKSS